MIELKNIVKSIDNNIIIDNVTFNVEKGSSLALVGSNGAGKSTILRLISGIYKSNSGQIDIDGEEVFDNPKAKEKIFFINDETIQFQTYTVVELKNYYKQFYPDFSEDIFEKLMSKISLPRDRKLNSFSKGMKRQAIVIIGIAAKTDYLLMDESFDGLDPAMRKIVKHMIFDAMSERNLTLIISSHNLREINEICDKFILIHNGKIVSSGDTDNSSGNLFKVQLAFKNKNQQLFEDTGSSIKIIDHTKSMSVHTYIVRGNKEDIKSFFNSYDLAVFDFMPLTLEETFIYEMEEKGYADYAE